MKNYFKEKIKILKRAQKEKWALGQFNVSNLEGMRAVFQAAKNLQSPFIIGTSEGESRYLGLKQAAALVRTFEKETGVSAILNLDHGKSFDYIREAIAAGYDMVHFDGSKLPLEENIKIAKEVAKYCRKKKVIIEGEVGFIAGASQVLKVAPEIKEEDLTDPDQAAKFVYETEIDSLAVNVGTFHGINAAGQNPHINLQRLKEIKARTGDRAFLVLHGGSGTPEEDIKEAIKRGIVKININTELRLAFTNALRKFFGENPKESTPYKYLPDAISAIRQVVENKMKLFNSVSKL